MSITLERVCKGFEGRAVLTDVSLTLQAGGRYCFFGPSGCGKTTLLRLICGLERPDSGRIVRPAELRFACHFQENRLLPWYTALENLALIGPEAEAWLARAELSEAAKQYPDELSGGMKRRLSLVRALMYPADVLALDEPVREMDEAMSTRMLRLIDASAGNRMLLLVTHDRRQAEALGCEIIPMKKSPA